MSLIKNKVYRAEIVDFTTEGVGVAKIDGMAVFVPNTAVGDQCDIKIIKVKKNIAFGKAENIIVSSKHRIEPKCDKSLMCGGCCYHHISYQEELRVKKKKVQDALKRIGGIDLEVDEIIGSEQIESYRNKAQYPVGQNESGIITGFYRNHSHDIVSTERCLIQTEQADFIVSIVREYMEKNAISVYNEVTGKGKIRHIYVRTGFATGQVILCIVATGTLKESDKLVDMVKEKCPYVVGIVLNINKDKGNKIMGDKCITLFGKETLEDILCDNVFKISPLSFYQVNRAQAERLYKCAVDYADLKGEETVLDLYCGAGTITLTLAKKAGKVIGAEIVPEAIENAKENAEINKIENVEFICADSGQAAQMLAHQGIKADVVVVDPPRKGIDALTIDAILRIQPKRVVYVSCDPATMARDIKILSESKMYQVVKCKAFDLFPRTHHVETCVLLSHKNS